MDFTKTLISFLTLVLLVSRQGIAQMGTTKSDSTQTYIIIHDSVRLNKIDSLTENINSQLGILQKETVTINERVKTIDGNTNDGILAEGAKNFMFTFVYELLGYKSGGSTGWFSKLV